MEEKVCLISGASAGLGVGIAECLVKAGFKKLVLVARRADKLQEVAGRCKDLGAEEVLCVAKDLADLAAPAEAVKEAVKKFRRLDVLVNNAGIVRSSPAAEMKTEDIQAVMNLNVTSTFVMTREALPHLRKGKGNIVFISSNLAHLSTATLSAYCASKSALTSYAKVVAVEEAQNGVRVNVVSPGAVPTEMLQTFVGKDKSMDDVGKFAKGFNPLNYASSSADIGNAVVYLANDATGGFCTGTDLVVDGGSTLKPA